MVENRYNQVGSKESVYKPHIIFGDNVLIVTFDHALTETLEELSNFLSGGPKTSFQVTPGKELYAGLRFMSQRILKEVRKGLEGYLENPDLPEGNKELLGLGVNQLNEVIGPKRK